MALNSTNSTSDLTEPERPEAPETSAPFVSHVSQLQKESAPPDLPRSSQEKENIPSSEQNDSQWPLAEAVPSSDQKIPASKIKQVVPPSEQTRFQGSITEDTPLEQDKSHSQIIKTYPSLQLNDSDGQIEEATPSLQQNDSERETTETPSSLQQDDSGSQTTLLDRVGDTEAFAAESDRVPGISEKTNPSTTSEPQEYNTVLPAESNLDHPLTVPQNDWSAMALARIEAAIRGLSEKREALLGMRVRVQESRNFARQKRLALTELNGQILQDIQRRAALGSSDSAVGSPELFVKLQDTLEELQVSEAELSSTEDLLNRKEWELKQAEVVVYQSGDFERANTYAEDSSSFIEELIVETASDSTIDAQPARTPLEKQYLSRKGDADILNEELDELRAHRAYLVEEDRTRQALGMSLNTESQRFLENFDIRHNQLQEDLFYAEEDIFRLQTMLSNSQDDVLYTANHFDLSQVDDGLLSDDVDAPDPLLLDIEAPSPGFSNVPLGLDQSRVSTIDYINEWLLHRLRRSPLEILLFKSELQDVDLDSEQLKDLVLRTWPRDDMSKVYSEARRRSRRSFSYNARSPQPNLSIQAAQSDSDIYHINRLGHRSQRGGRMTSRHRSSVTLDRPHNQPFRRPSIASSI